MDVISLFSGGGGLDLGFIREGYNIVWAIDINKNAVETYKKNIGNHIVCEDINKVLIKEMPNCDVIIGGPPCQSFSLAGKRNMNDVRGELIWKYLEIIKIKQPSAFVFENVTGLLSAKNKTGRKVIDELTDAFTEIGYVLSKNIINAADYGVPQRRKRVFLIGLKEKLFVFPKPTHSDKDGTKKKYVSVKDALSDLPNVESENMHYSTEPMNYYQKIMREKGLTVTDQEVPTMSDLDKYIISHVKPGGNYRDIPDDVDSVRIKRLKKEGGRTTYYGRLNPDEPSYTINTYFNRPNVGCNIHYSQDRLITPREALRLQGFPDSYEIVSKSKHDRNLIIGNAVPPILSQIIAKELKNYVR